jgi:hypothetical protein
VSNVTLSISGLSQIEYNYIMTFVDSILGEEMLYGEELADFLGCIVAELQGLDTDGEWCYCSANKDLLNCAKGLHYLANRIEEVIKEVESRPHAPPPPFDLPKAPWAEIS